MVVNYLPRLTSLQSVAECSNFWHVDRPVAHVYKDPAERAVIIASCDDVNPLNRPLAEDRLEYTLHITPVDVVKCARNADARLSD